VREATTAAAAAGARRRRRRHQPVRDDGGGCHGGWMSTGVILCEDGGSGGDSDLCGAGHCCSAPREALRGGVGDAGCALGRGDSEEKLDALCVRVVGMEVRRLAFSVSSPRRQCRFGVALAVGPNGLCWVRSAGVHLWCHGGSSGCAKPSLLQRHRGGDGERATVVTPQVSN
jgi:hypothetical protein